MSLELKKRGNSWTYVVDIGRDPVTGARRRKSKGGFKTKPECRAAAAKIITELSSGEYVESNDLTVEVFMKKWLKEYAKKNTAPTTYIRYEGIIEKSVIPYMGNVKLNKLTSLQLQEFYTYNIDELGKSSTTVKQYHAVISKALSMALKWGLINRNICVNVEKPKKAHSDMLVLNEEQLTALLDRLKGMTMYIAAVIAAYTGMRLGEICGLTWDNVDLKEGVIFVKQQLQEINGTVQIVPLKTKASRRKISIPNFLINILKELKKEQFNNMQYFQTLYQHNYVVCQADGKPYSNQYLSRNFRRIMSEYKVAEKLNIPKIRFHDLRHTHATILLLHNVPVKVISERLGHASISITLDTYAHVLPNMQKEVADKLDSIFLAPSANVLPTNQENATK